MTCSSAASEQNGYFSSKKSWERFGASVGWRFPTSSAGSWKGREVMGGGSILAFTFSRNPCPCKYTWFCNWKFVLPCAYIEKQQGKQPWSSVLRFFKYPQVGFVFRFLQEGCLHSWQFVESQSALPVEPREWFMSSQTRDWYLIRLVVPYTHYLKTILFLKQWPKHVAQI